MANASGRAGTDVSLLKFDIGAVSSGTYGESEGLMEMLSHHDALEEIDASLAEAAVCLESGDRDDFLRLMVTVDHALQRLREEEALSWSNIY